jgi:hypothetical protein
VAAFKEVSDALLASVEDGATLTAIARARLPDAPRQPSAYPIVGCVADEVWDL